MDPSLVIADLPALDVNEGIDRLNELVEAAGTGVVKNDLESDVRWKSHKLTVKSVSEDGTLDGYASVYWVIDSDDEIVLPGCFDRSLKNNPHPVVLWQHDIKQPVGFHVTEEIGGDKTKGLPIRAELMLDCDPGRYAYAFTRKAQKIGGKAGISVGFRVIKYRWVKGSDLPKWVGADSSKTYKAFEEAQLLEYSICTFPANSAAFVTAVKSAFDKSAANADDSALHDAVSEQGGDITDGAKGNSTVDEPITTKATAPTTDFDQSLANKHAERELRKHRGDIEDALYDTLSAIHSGDFDDDSKKAMIGDCYKKHAEAMTNWHVKAYFSSGSKSFDASIARKALSDAIATTGEPLSTASETVIKAGKMSAAGKATVKHALDLHSSAIDLHNKAMRIVKDAFGDDSSPELTGGDSAVGTEMSDNRSVDTKTEADPAAAQVAEPTVETKSDEGAQSERTPQNSTDSDPGIHSLTELLAEMKTRLESV